MAEGPEAGLPQPGQRAGGEGALAAASLAAYTNNPLQGRFARRIVPELRAFLEARLPAYMMPSAFVLLDALPITPNGKVDRRRLPAPGGSPESGRSLVAARNATEERLLAIWKELLGVERIGVEDDFFALGGHSLLATQAVSRVRQAFGVELPLRTFFEAPSVASVAAEISSLRLGGGEADVPPIVPVPRDGRLPLSFAQERLWFLDRLEARTLAYNEAAAFRLEGPLDTAAFRGALDEILLRHESLRTTFPEVDGEAVQVIRPAAPFEIPVVDLRALPEDLHGEEIHRLALSQALRPFSLAHGPLVRGLLMRLGENDHAVLFSFHHIIFDGWSVGVFVRELSALYRARVAGVPASLPPLAIQYADFAAWQRGWLQGEVLERQVAWWRGQLTGAAVLELPTDRPRPILAQAPSGLLHPLLRPSLTEPLRAFSRDHGATLFMTLLAGFQALLHRHTGQTDISVGTPIANRNHGDVEKLIGFFVNMLVLRTDLSGDPGFGDLVDRVRQTALGAYDHQSVPFAKLVEELRPERDLRHTPLFQVSFQVLNVPQSPLELPGITLHPLSFAARSAKFDLDLALTDAADRLSGVLDYNADLFDATTMERFLAHLEQLLLGAMDDPARRLSELPLLTAAERSQLAIEWNDTASASADPPCLHHWIARRIAEAPEALAAVCEDRRLTFGDLGRQSASLALRLREHGVGPEVPVVLFLDRSVEAIAGFVGILEAGGVYVPVDPTYPAERIAWILEDCKAPVVVTTSDLAGRLPNGTPAVLLDESVVAPLSRRQGRRRGIGGEAPRRSSRLHHLHLRLDRPAQGRRRPARRDGELRAGVARGGRCTVKRRGRCGSASTPRSPSTPPSSSSSSSPGATPSTSCRRPCGWTPRRWWTPCAGSGSTCSTARRRSSGRSSTPALGMEAKTPRPRSSWWAAKPSTPTSATRPSRGAGRAGPVSGTSMGRPSARSTRRPLLSRPARRPRASAGRCRTSASTSSRLPAISPRWAFPESSGSAEPASRAAISAGRT